MDKMRLAVHFGSRESWYYVLLLLSSLSARLAPPLRPFAFRAPPGLCLLLLALLPHLHPFASRAPLLASVFCFCLRFVLHDKKRVLFCGFTEANFFATWGNAENRRSRSQKSTEKWGVFIMGDFVVREVDRVRRTNKAILGCTWNRRCACVFVVRCNREARCKARKSLRKLPIRRSLAKLGEAGRKHATHPQGKTMRKVLR